jgi:GAF domain-containing protein
MRPVGLGDELRAALVVRGPLLGLPVHAPRRRRARFTTAEADVIRRLAPHIAHALRQAILLHRPASDRPHRPGVVLLDEEMELVASTPETDALLPLIGHGSRQLTPPVVVTLSPPCSHL